MKRKDLIILFEKIEKEIPVSEWKFGDMDIWPIIKKDIFFLWYNKQIIIDQNESKIRKSTLLFKLIKILESLYYLLKLKFFSPKKVGNLYCGAYSHRIEYEGDFINRYFFPFQNNKNSGDYVHIEYGRELSSKNYYNYKGIVFTSKLYPIYRFFQLFKNNPLLSLPRWEEFQILMENKVQLDLNKYYLKLSKRFEPILAFTEIYHFLFKKYKPKNIMSLCYYKDETFGMHYTANKLNISNYDVQHGGQGRLHPMYSFMNFPKRGFNTLPKSFWCWDVASAEHIELWLQKSNVHNVEVNGNPWIQYQSNYFDQYDDLTDKKIILYTLQENELEAYILETIKLTPSDFTWWLRLHPRMKDDNTRIERQLQNMGLTDKVEISKASELPLPLLLHQSYVHISKCSGSIIESVQLKTPNIIIDEIGVEVYQDYIDNGDAYTVLTKSAHDLLNAIEKITYKSKK